MGLLYAQGDEKQGVTPDDTEAAAWFTKAAEHGSVAAQYKLGPALLGWASWPAKRCEQSVLLDCAGPRRRPGKQQGTSQSPGQRNDACPGRSHRTPGRDLVPAARIPRQAKPRPLTPPQCGNKIKIMWETIKLNYRRQPPRLSGLTGKQDRFLT